MSIRCPRCHGKTDCYDSRPNEIGDVVRKFACRECTCTFRSIEQITHINGAVVDFKRATRPTEPITADNAISMRWRT